jgi:hypothetical protein
MRRQQDMANLKVRALITRDDPQHKSRRTVEEVVEIFKGVNEIWRQAEIGFDATVAEWKSDHEMLNGVVQAASNRLSDTEVLSPLTGRHPGEITGIYLNSIGGSSGKVFRPKKTFIIVDSTKISASRTTAHEIGHMFDLEHWLDHPPPEPPDRPPNQLMARTQVGTDLIPRDIEQVRRRLPTCGLLVMQ